MHEKTPIEKSQCIKPGRNRAMMGKEKQWRWLAWGWAVGAPTRETSPAIEDLLVDGFAAGGTGGTTSRSGDKPSENGTSDAAARGADGTTDHAGCCPGFRAGESNGDSACDAGCRADGTADAPR
ncbi:hypothetical protein [Burkholderia pseudomallei]|uniref:hypothetical protein n=1 Tax=Burkholderia pseudomallei TaxID=28450 RepID=UPI0012F4E5EC|nr:hypothetical protein [Burkholderia pseudomallei]